MKHTTMKAMLAELKEQQEEEKRAAIVKWKAEKAVTKGMPAKTKKHIHMLHMHRLHGTTGILKFRVDSLAKAKEIAEWFEGKTEALFYSQNGCATVIGYNYFYERDHAYSRERCTKWGHMGHVLLAIEGGTYSYGKGNLHLNYVTDIATFRIEIEFSGCPYYVQKVERNNGPGRAKTYETQAKGPSHASTYHQWAGGTDTAGQRKYGVSNANSVSESLSMFGEQNG